MTGTDRRWVAFLRGVNVGGRHRAPMREVASLVAASGANEVRTYLQSGNVVFRGDRRTARAVEAEFSDRAEAHFGFAVPVVVRSVDELRAALGANPFLIDGVDEGSLHVAFLAEIPAPDDVAALDPDRSPPDAFAVRGREVYLHLPRGMARTRLTTAYLDAALHAISTARNWRTARAVLALADA